MRVDVHSILTIILCQFARVAFSIYSDEAYQLDYHHALLGIPQAHTTFFHRPSANSKASLLYTLSESGIVGAVNPKDGAVLWRQSLGKEERNLTGNGSLKAGEGLNSIFSALGGSVQAWDAVDGRLGWEWQGHGRVKALEVFKTNGDETEVLILSEEDGSNGIVRCFEAETGTFKWEYKDSSGDTPYSLILTEDSIYYVSLHSAILKGFRIKIAELNPSNGQQKGYTHAIGSENEVSSENSILFAGVIGGLPAVIWSDKAFNFVKVSSLLKKQTTTLGALSNDGESAEGVILHAPTSKQSKPHFLLHLKGRQSHWAKVYHFDIATETVTKAYDLPSVSGKSSFSTSVQKSEVYFIRHTPSDVTLVSSTSSSSLQDWLVPPQPHADVTHLREASHAVTEVVSRGGSKFSVRSALTLVTGEWELIRNGESLWVAPEGLTGIVAATFVDSALGEDLAQELAVERQYNLVSAYLYRVRRHVKELQYLPALIQDQYTSLRAALLGDDGSKRLTRTRRDKFGFNKAVIVATRYGHIAAFDAGNRGRVLWNVQAVKLGSGETWDVISIEAEAGSALIRAAKGEFLRIESRTGKIINRQTGSLLDGLETTVPIFDVHGQQALVPVNADGSLGEIPKADFGDATIVVTRGASNILRGWSLSRDRKPAQIWQFVPFSGEKISEVTHRPAHDPVASIGKALGDRNVLYKYLNPNLVLITTVNAPASTASFYLVDSASGTLLYSIKYSDVDLSQTISSSIFENLISYSLFSTTHSQDPLQLNQQKLRSHQLVVSELYESPFPNDRGPLGLASNFSSRHPTTPTETKNESPHVISQTFLIPGAISHMSVTSTLQGITPRSLLCVVPHLSSLFSLPRYLLDPRRPVGRDPTTAEMEEGLMRYNAMLDFDPKWSLNHKRELLGLEKVITSPSLLESTSLVFAFGDADIFGTRTSPIGGFDLLGNGFSKLQLVGTVAALAVGTAFLAPLVSCSSSFVCFPCDKGYNADLSAGQVRKKQIDGIWKA